MKKLFLLGLCMHAFGIVLYAQHAKALDELLTAEKKFAATSAEQSTRTAFLENLADDAILFKRAIVNGKDFWQQVDEGADKLTWSPQFADVSSGGDFGYTTGPFQQFQNRTDAQPVASGHYISVWQKKNGVWKVLIDGGVGHPPVDMNAWETTSSILPEGSKASTALVTSELQKLEAALLEQLKQQGSAAFTPYLSAEARMYRPMAPPYRKNDIPALLAETDKKFTYTPPVGITVAPAGDMAFTYGNVDIEITRAGNTRQLKGFYSRIWKREKGAGWKIVIDHVTL
jgi:ketosteroid isomerase-like protein